MADLTLSHFLRLNTSRPALLNIPSTLFILTLEHATQTAHIYRTFGIRSAFCFAMLQHGPIGTTFQQKVKRTNKRTDAGLKG